MKKLSKLNTKEKRIFISGMRCMAEKIKNYTPFKEISDDMDSEIAFCNELELKVINNAENK